MLAKERETLSTRHLSVSNAGIYQSQFEKDQLEYSEGKKKWMSEKDITTTQIDTRLNPSHANCGRPMAAWDDVPKFVDVHAGLWKQKNAPVSYCFRDVEKLEPTQQPFYTVIHKEDNFFQAMATKWEEQSAIEAIGMPKSNFGVRRVSAGSQRSQNTRSTRTAG